MDNNYVIDFYVTMRDQVEADENKLAERIQFALQQYGIVVSDLKVVHTGIHV